MGVAATGFRISYNANGVTTVFSFPYLFLSQSHLRVLVTASGVTVEKTLTTDFTVSGEGDESGGSVIFLTPPASGSVVYIVRTTTPDQGVDYVSGDNFPAETHETALDKLTLMVQELTGRVQDETGNFQGLALVYPLTDAETISNVVPPSSERASLLLGFDSASEPTTYAPADLNLVLLDSDPALGGVSSSNLAGATQLAIKTRIDLLQTEVDDLEADVLLNTNGLLEHEELLRPTLPGAKYISENVFLSADLVNQSFTSSPPVNGDTDYVVDLSTYGVPAGTKAVLLYLNHTSVARGHANSFSVSIVGKDGTTFNGHSYSEVTYYGSGFAQSQVWVDVSSSLIVTFRFNQSLTMDLFDFALSLIHHQAKLVAYQHLPS